ncbi:hypothetical protein K431DRAFT_143134 [Polychaeton citri CBS 116435]|uniref:Uncharacterized protein n=1 Tax=Polychaeton citri CBS 116435 TaxID=1314669 RepID=A0A9P4Q1Z8_9PEZI|nr:hypothetical protein K431DRAFT_143134 [Polychaeton citri CBS 116435]
MPRPAPAPASTPASTSTCNIAFFPVSRFLVAPHILRLPGYYQAPRLSGPQGSKACFRTVRRGFPACLRPAIAPFPLTASHTVPQRCCSRQLTTPWFLGFLLFHTSTCTTQSPHPSHAGGIPWLLPRVIWRILGKAQRYLPRADLQCNPGEPQLGWVQVTYRVGRADYIKNSQQTRPTDK